MDFLCDTSRLYTIHGIEVDLLCDTSGLCLQHRHVFMCIALSRSHKTEVPAVWHHCSRPTKEDWRTSCVTPWCSTNDAKLCRIVVRLHSAYHSWKDLCNAIALLMIAYIVLFSALLSRLTALTWGSTWETSFIARFLNIHQSDVLCLPHRTGRTCAIPLHSAFHTELEGLMRPLHSAHCTDPKDLLSDSVRMHKQLQMLYFCLIWRIKKLKFLVYSVLECVWVNMELGVLLPVNQDRYIRARNVYEFHWSFSAANKLWCALKNRPSPVCQVISKPAKSSGAPWMPKGHASVPRYLCFVQENGKDTQPTINYSQ